MFKRQRIIEITLLVAAAIAGASVFFYAWYQIVSGYLHGDALIFQAVGRGMLNGYKPYTDLFETKPPGVFLLHALSWKLFGSQLLVSIASAALLIGVPQQVLSRSLTLLEGKSGADRRFFSLLTLLFGLTLSLYVANQAGGGLAEGYGAYVGIAFLGLLLLRHEGYLKSVLLGVLLLLAVGFKEPFLLSVLAGAILLLPTPKSAISTIVIPACIAAVLGIGALFALGLFDPFFDVYLPHMLGFHVYQHDGSTFVRALQIWRTFINMGAFSWGFAVAVTALWLYVGYVSPVRLLIGSYLTLVAIAVGGDFYGHHFIFAVPFYVALWWVFLRSTTGRVAGITKSIIAVALVVSSVLSMQFSYASESSAWRQKEDVMQHAARTIDAVMDRCNWEKYLQIIPRVGDSFAYTDHVPYGPIFLHYSRFIGAKREYQTAFIRALNEAQIALVLDLATSNLSEDAIEFMGVHFSEQPPACVGGEFVQPAPYTLLFRKAK